jgi:hypothetical protein
VARDVAAALFAGGDVGYPAHPGATGPAGPAGAVQLVARGP